MSYIFAKGDGIIFNGFSNFGPMLIALMPAFLTGLYKLFKDKLPQKRLILTWFISASAASIFLAITPNTEKFIYALFPLSIVTAVGLVSLNKKIVLITLVIVFFNLAVVGYDALYKETKRQEPVFRSNTFGLIDFINQKTSGNVWVTDQTDRDLGVKIGYLKQVPFTAADLKDNSSNIAKQPVKTINNLYIGYKDRLKENPKNFDYILKTKNEKYYGCFILQDSFGEGDNMYLLMAKYECEDNGLEH